MSSASSCTLSEVKAKNPGFNLKKTIITTLPIMMLTASSMAFALDGITSKYVGSEAGGWSGSDQTVGPPDSGCANMGAVGKVNVVYNFGFNLPLDSVITSVEAFIKAGATTDQNVTVEVTLDATAVSPVFIGDPQILTAFGSGSGNCASTQVDSVGGNGITAIPATSDFGLAPGEIDAADVNSPLFGLNFVKLETSTIKVDSVCLEIGYSTVSGPASTESCFAVNPFLTLEKTVTNDNGGIAVDTDWTLTATGPVVISGVEGAAAITGAEVTAGAYTLTESSVTGYAPASPTALSCIGGVLVGNVITLVDGDSATCTFFNNDVSPTLTLVKSVTNNNGGTAVASEWTLAADGPGLSDFSGTTGVSSSNLIAGAHNLSESGGPAGYTPSDWVCVGGTQNDGDTVTLALGESSTCTITNDDNATSLTLVKQVTNNNGGTAVASQWTLSADGPGANDISGAGGATSNSLAAGIYDLSESGGPAGYTPSAWVCVGGTQNDGDTVTLALGESSTCTITNDDDASGLTVVKTISSDNGGTATLDDFDVSVDAVEVLWDSPASTTGGSKLVTTAAGTYTLSEGSVDGYTPGVWSCMDSEGVVAVTNSGAAGGADVTVGLGQSVTCSITNADDDTALIVSKTISSDNGGTASLDDFNISVDAVEVSWTDPNSTTSGFETFTDQSGTYVLSEDDVPGYTEGAWSCSDSEGVVAVTNSGAFGGASVTVNLGQVVTCSITNTDDPVSLTLIKQVTNNSGGTAVASQWTVSADGPDANDISGAGSANSSSLSTGTYDLSESGGPAGYTPSAWVCVGGTQDDDDTVSLALGESSTCTITNDDDTAHLAIEKIVDNGQGGFAIPEDWQLSANGPTPIGGNGGAEDDVNAGTYNLSELLLDPGVNVGGTYQAGPWQCEGGSLDGNQLTLALGQSASCTIVNTFIPIVAIPVNNFWALLLMIMALIATGWYFRPAFGRKF